MIRFRQPATLALLGALFACRADQTTGNHLTTSPPTPVLVKTTQWAGGEIEIQSVGFKGAGALPVVTANAETLAIRRVDDSTVAARMPAQAGAYTVRVGAGGYTTAYPPLTLYGFSEEEVGPVMSGRVALVNPGAASPLVLSYGDSGAVVVDLAANGVVATIPDSVASPDCAWSPGPSYRGAGYFVVQGAVSGTCRTPQVWRLYPSVTPVTTTSPVIVFPWYVMAEVGASRWYAENNNHEWFWPCDSQPCEDAELTWDIGAWKVALDPAGGIFVPTPSAYPGWASGPPSSFAVSTLDTATRYTQLGALLDGVFTATGDTLFAFAQAPSDTPRVYAPMHLTAVQASSGAVARDQPLDSLGFGAATQLFSAVAADPAGPYLYALTGYAVDSTVVPTLVVLDRASWSVVGIAMASGSSAATENTLALNGAGWIIPAPRLHKVFVVVAYLGYNEHGHPATILVFDTP